MSLSQQITAPAVQALLRDGALAGEWVLDPSRSTVSLRNKSLWGLAPVNGVFRQVTGNGSVSPAGEVRGAFAVAVSSIDTRNSKRDRHLRSGDFFDSDRHPDITFTVAGIRASGHSVTVTGTLSVRGRTRPLTFDGAATVHGDGEVRLDAAVRVNQADFGLTWNVLGTVSMTSTVTVHAVFTRASTDEAGTDERPAGPR